MSLSLSKRQSGHLLVCEWASSLKEGMLVFPVLLEYPLSIQLALKFCFEGNDYAVSMEDRETSQNTSDDKGADLAFGSFSDGMAKLGQDETRHLI
jgi:hypothetical protein